MSTPPPTYENQPNPYAGGQPTAQAPYQAPYQAQPPAGPYGAQPQPPQPGLYPPMPAPKKSHRGRNIALRLGVLVLLAGGWFVYDQVSGGADTAKAGDCVHNSGTQNSPDIHVISCTDAKADYKVLKTTSDTTESACVDVVGYELSYVQTGRSDLQLCLGAVYH